MFVSNAQTKVQMNEHRLFQHIRLPLIDKYN